MSLAAVLQFDGLGRLHAQQRSGVAPAMLEAFAARPDSRTTWSKFIARIDGPAAYAVVSAVALESRAAAPERMRGVRIELRHESLRESCNLRASVLKGQAEVHLGRLRSAAFRVRGKSLSCLLPIPPVNPGPAAS
jgi:hypothetical protein